MTEKDLLTAFSEVNEDYIEHAATALEGRKKPAGGWLKRTALLAAALCLVIAGTVGAWAWMSENASPDQGYLPLLNHIADTSQITGMQQVEIGDYFESFGGAAESRLDIYYSYQYGIVVSARVVEVLPDTYKLPPNYSKEYHILRLAVNEVITGHNVPQEFYYLLPAEMSTDLAEYTDLIMAIGQAGRDDYLVFNQTQSRLEALTLLFHTYGYHPAYGPVLPFQNGTLDMGLWEKEGWTRYAPHMQRYLELEETHQHIGFPACRGCSLEEVKTNIRALSEENDDLYVYTLADIPFEEAQKVIAYVKPFVNGAFQQYSIARKNSIQYTRLINGFDTYEFIGIDCQTGEVRYSDERYTAEDLQKVPDLGALVEYLSENLPDPPKMNTDALYQKGVRIHGWYRKVDGKIYGIANIEWLYADDLIAPSAQYKDGAYYLVSPDGSWRAIEPDELRKIVGDDGGVDDYNPEIPIPTVMY